MPDGDNLDGDDRANHAGPMPGRVLLCSGRLPADPVPVRIQVPGWQLGRDPVPAALPLPGPAREHPDALPDRARVRPAGHVQRDRVPAGDLRVVPGQAVLRQVPGRPVLRGPHVVGALPGRVLLPGGVLCAGAMPGRALLPARLRRARRVRGRGGLGPGGRVGEAVRQAALTRGRRRDGIRAGVGKQHKAGGSGVIVGSTDLD